MVTFPHKRKGKQLLGCSGSYFLLFGLAWLTGHFGSAGCKLVVVVNGSRVDFISNERLTIEFTK